METLLRLLLDLGNCLRIAILFQILRRFLAGVNIVMRHFLGGVRIVMRRFLAGVNIAMRHFLGGVIIYWSSASIKIYGCQSKMGGSGVQNLDSGLWTPPWQPKSEIGNFLDKAPQDPPTPPPPQNRTKNGASWDSRFLYSPPSKVYNPPSKGGP